MKVLLNGNMVPARAQVVEDDQGVVVGLKEIIGDNPGTARMIGIKLDANNQPEPESLQQAARWRAIVRTFFR